MKSLLRESNLANAISTTTVKNDEPDMLVNVSFLQLIIHFMYNRTVLILILRATENNNPFAS